MTIPVTPPRDGERHQPTHLVVNGVAHRIEPEPLLLDPAGIVVRADLDHRRASVRWLAGQAVLDVPAGTVVTVNGDSIEGRTALVPGDRLRLGAADGEILVVTMHGGLK